MDKGIRRLTAVEYCKKFPKTANRTIARALIKDHPGLYDSTDQARGVVRQVRGAAGTRNSRSADVPKPHGWQKVELPQSTAQIREPFIFPEPSRILLLSDIHFPFHDRQALDAAVAWGRKLKPTHVLLNGDTVENYGISRWEPDPRRRDVPGEISIARQGVKWIRERFPKAEILFKHGNHEDRLESYLMRNAAALLGVEDFEMGSLLRLGDLGISQIASRQIAHAGKLVIIHGHELPRGISNPVNPARGMYLRLNETAICGHFHQTSQHTDATGIHKKYISCWSTGCLCDLAPDYAIANKWNHGAAFVEVDKGGNFIVNNAKIIEGQVY